MTWIKCECHLSATHEQYLSSTTVTVLHEDKGLLLGTINELAQPIIRDICKKEHNTWPGRPLEFQSDHGTEQWSINLKVKVVKLKMQRLMEVDRSLMILKGRKVQKSEE